MRGKARTVDGHRHRIDQERHVVGGYCDQGVSAFESFAVLVRVEHADLCRLCLALTCGFEHELGNTRPFGRITGGDVIGRHMAGKMRCKPAPRVVCWLLPGPKSGSGWVPGVSIRRRHFERSFRPFGLLSVGAGGYAPTHT